MWILSSLFSFLSSLFLLTSTFSTATSMDRLVTQLLQSFLCSLPSLKLPLVFPPPHMADVAKNGKTWCVLCCCCYVEAAKIIGREGVLFSQNRTEEKVREIFQSILFSILFFQGCVQVRRQQPGRDRLRGGLPQVQGVLRERRPRLRVHTNSGEKDVIFSLPTTAQTNVYRPGRQNKKARRIFFPFLKLAFFTGKGSAAVALLFFF